MMEHSTLTPHMRSIGQLLIKSGSGFLHQTKEQRRGERGSG